MKTTMFNLHTLNQRIKVYQLNWLMYLLVFLFFVGLIIGSFTIKNSENIFVERIVSIYSDYLKQKNSFRPLNVFMYTFLLSITAIFSSFFVGLCAVGIPFIVIVPISVGVIIGIISGYLYESFLLKGLGYCAIIIFPAAAIAIVGILFSCKESILMSKSMLSLLANGRSQNQNYFKSYCTKFIIYAGICALAAVIETILYHFFSDLFIF